LGKLPSILRIKQDMQTVNKKLYSSSNIIRMRKSRRMRRDGHVARMEKEK
jgi:hypothetical protein